MKVKYVCPIVSESGSDSVPELLELVVDLLCGVPISQVFVVCPMVLVPGIAISGVELFLLVVVGIVLFRPLMELCMLLSDLCMFRFESTESLVCIGLIFSMFRGKFLSLSFGC